MPVLDENAQMSASGGKFKPSLSTRDKYFRILIVFAEFSNDSRNFSDWTYGQMPTYAGNLLDTIKNSVYRSMTVSDYWKVMSRGGFDIILTVLL